MSASEQPSLRNRTVRSVFWIVWSRGALQVLAFATTLAVAHILRPADYGVMAVAGIWTSALSTLAEMGLGSAIVQFRDLTKQEIDTCFWAIMAVAVAGYALLTFCAPLIADWFSIPALAQVLPVLSLALPLLAIRVVPDSLLRKELALHRVSQAEIIGGVVVLPVTLGCALAGLGVWALVAGALVGPAVRTIATFVFLPWRPGFSLGGERVKEVFHFSIATLGTNILWVLREQADVFVIGKLTGENTVGLYAMAKQLALMPTDKISSVVNMLSAPIMAELQNQPNLMRVALFRALRFAAIFSLPACVGAVFVAPDLVAVMLGEQWMPIVPLLRALMLYSGMRAMDVLLPSVLLARRRERFLLWYCLLLVIVVPLAAGLGAMLDGPIGAVLCWVPVYGITMTVMAKTALEEVGSGFAEVFSELRPILIATASMTLVLALTYGAVGVVGVTPLIHLLLIVPLGATVFGSVLLATRSTVATELLELFGWLTGRTGKALETR